MKGTARTPPTRTAPIDENIINEPDVLALVEEAAEKGMVLLENRENFLPLADGTRVLVVGP